MRNRQPRVELIRGRQPRPGAPDPDDPEGIVAELRNLGFQQVDDDQPAPYIPFYRRFSFCFQGEEDDDYELNDLRAIDVDPPPPERSCFRRAWDFCCLICCCCCYPDDDEIDPEDTDDEYVLFDDLERRLTAIRSPEPAPVPVEQDPSEVELEDLHLQDSEETPEVDSTGDEPSEQEPSQIEPDELTDQSSSEDLPIVQVPLPDTVASNYLYAAERRREIDGIRRDPSKFPALFPDRYEYDSHIELGFPVGMTSKWGDAFSFWSDIIGYFPFAQGTLNPLVRTCRAALYAWLHHPNSNFELYSELEKAPELIREVCPTCDDWMYQNSVICSYTQIIRFRSHIGAQGRILNRCLKSISMAERGDLLLRRILSEYPSLYLTLSMDTSKEIVPNLSTLLKITKCTDDQITEWYNWSVAAISRVCDTIDNVHQRQYFEERCNSIRDSFVSQIREGVAFMNQSTRDFIERLAKLHQQEFRKVSEISEDVRDFTQDSNIYSLHYENLTVAKAPTGFHDVAGLQLIGVCKEWHLPVRTIVMDYLMRDIINQFADRIDIDKYNVPDPTLDLVHEGLSKYVPRPFKADFDDTIGGISFRTWLYSVMDEIYGYKDGEEIPPIDPEIFSAEEHLTPNSRSAFPGLSWSQRKFRTKADCVSAAIPVAKDLQTAYSLNTLPPHYWVVITVPKVCKREKPQVRIACAPEMHYYILNTLYLWDFVERAKVTPGRANFEPFFMHFHDAVTRLFSRTNYAAEQVDLVHQGGRTPAPVLRLFSTWLGRKMCIRDRTVLNSIIEEQINAKIILPAVFGGDVLRTRSGWKDGAFGTSQVDSWVVTSYHLWMLFRAVKDDPPSPQLIARWGPPLSWWKHVRVESHGDNWLSTHPQPLNRWLSWSSNELSLRQLGQEATIVQGIRPERFELMGFRITPHTTYRGDIIFVGSRPPEKTVKSLLYRRRLYKDAERNNAYIRSIIVALRFTDSWNDTSRMILDEVTARYSAGNFKKAHTTISSFDTRIVELAQSNPSLLLSSGRDVWTNRRDEIIYPDDDTDHDVF